ncbi:hypothetical protein ACO0K7_09110 [Undibacterium sp. Ji67W]|uniref:hypothetical protein n=1 Tax=Undibacterium sp. Ji67W TaxID=3413042 RepID=UPI003BF2F68A
MKRLITLILAASFLTGCATVNEMAFDKKSTSLDTSQKSVVLMTVEVSRSDNSRFVPEPNVVRLDIPGVPDKAGHQNFKINKESDFVATNDHKIYLIRMALPPGTYRLDDVTGFARAFPINGMFMVPLYVNFTVQPNSVTYVGRVNAQLRSRKDGEFRAGPVVPLIDQAAAGMSGGTWDISIDDLAESDIETFRSNFPVLSNLKIEKIILPAFDRQLVQDMWDGKVKLNQVSISTSTNTVK